MPKKVSEGENDEPRFVSAVMSRRSAIKKTATIGCITGLGATGYLAVFSGEAAAELGKFTVKDTTIATADGTVDGVELEIDTFEIEHVNLTDEGDVTARLELIDSGSDPDISDAILEEDTTVTIPHDGDPNDEKRLSEFESAFDLLEETDLSAGDFEIETDGATGETTLNFRATVEFSDHESLAEDFEETDTATVTVENAKADADAEIDGTADGTPETEPHDLE